MVVGNGGWDFQKIQKVWEEKEKHDKWFRELNLKPGDKVKVSTCYNKKNPGVYEDVKEKRITVINFRDEIGIFAKVDGTEAAVLFQREIVESVIKGW